MARVQVRITIDSDLWAAVEAVARAKKLTPSRYIERAVNMAIDPVQQIETAAQQIYELRSNLIATQDQIGILSDYIVDANGDFDAGSNED